jgi:predicted transcriptional regulator
MGDTTTVRVDRSTHDALKRLADERGSTVTETVAAAVRLLRQDRMGAELAEPLRDDEHEWLDADVG